MAEPETLAARLRREADCPAPYRLVPVSLLTDAADALDAAQSPEALAARLTDAVLEEVREESRTAGDAYAAMRDVLVAALTTEARAAASHGEES